MNNNEILEGIKKAFKLSVDKLDNHYMFYLDEMVTPKLITLFYWILLFAFITKRFSIGQFEKMKTSHFKCEN